METTPCSLLCDGRRSQPLHAVTWIQKEHQDRMKGGNAGNRVRTLGKVDDEGENEDCSERVPDAGCGETSGQGHQKQRQDGRTEQRHGRHGRHRTHTPATLWEERGHHRQMPSQSDPSNPGGTGTQKTSDPEILRTETPPFPLPGDDKRSQTLRAVTWIQKEHQDGVKGGNAGTRVRTLGKADDEGENEDCGERVPDAGCGETSGKDIRSSARTAGQSRGTGGTELTLRPRSGKSVASTGAWHIPAERGGVEEVGITTVP
ncbi:hypothetical protein NDU88_003097 [Pleurodeles waltl]|uniref:Uncharacterized protein n=1 Tax=Pleurodeles waltl TaxID=8319 RepID=A0AAV7KTX5_PLEWA|nr:hypothetical protein NDU88_003097 [Pleurodeles waltl]